VQRASFVRGFPERFTLTVEGFLAHADALFHLSPARHIILTDIGDRLPELANSPYLGRIRTLEFRTFAAHDVRALLRSAYLGRLTGLILRFGKVEDTDAAALAATPTLAGLQVLDLYGCGLGPAGVQSLAASPHLAGLRDLVLGGNEEVGDEGADALASPDTQLTHLTSLHLSFAGVSDTGAQALAVSPALAGLRSLDLGYNEIGASGARALADSPHLRSLMHLGLRGNPISRRARQTLSAQQQGRIRF
jgi:hypothetical protein